MDSPTEVRSPLAAFFSQDEPWKEQAACKGKNHLFFLERGQSSKPAKRICASCPVQAECDEYRVRTRSEYGIWAGRTARRYDTSSVSQPPSTIGPNPTEGELVGLKSLSASSGKMYLNCPAQWWAVYGSAAYPPDVDNDAAKLGQALHAALESYVKAGDLSDFDTLVKLYQKEYEDRFADTGFYKPGLAMLTTWWQRNPLSDGRTVLHTEQKKRFRIPVNGRQIPVNFILDRHDLRTNGEHEVVDYKSSSIPMQPEALSTDLQARIYALGVQLEYPDADGVWVTFDMLRYDSVSRWFTKDENRETYRFLVRLATKMDNDTDHPETLNPDCRFCIRKFGCATLQKHVKAQGPLSIDDPDKAADQRRELEHAEKVIKNMREQLDAYLLRYAEENDLLEFETDSTVVKITASRRRVFDRDAVLGIVGTDLMAANGNVTLAVIDEWIDSEELTMEQRSSLKGAIEKKFGDAKIKTEMKK